MLTAVNFNSVYLYDLWVKNFKSKALRNNISLDAYLYKKLNTSTLFFPTMDFRIFPSYNFFHYHDEFLINFPGLLHFSSFEEVLREDPMSADFISVENHLKACLRDIITFWYFFPEIISDFYKYYSEMNITFSQEEFIYIDFWLEVFRVVENILGFLLQNDTPLLKNFPSLIKPKIFSENNSLRRTLIINVSTQELQNIENHLKEYYFGEGSNDKFKNVLYLYLENRLELKNKCIKSLNEDLNKSTPLVTTDLVEYLICHYLVKNISKNTLKFIVANLPLDDKQPLSLAKNFFKEKWKNFDDVSKNEILQYNAEKLEKLKNRKLFQ